MITLYNTLTKQKDVFEPIHAGKVGMYTCGPTVYGYVHIGNLRAYLTADILRRTLEHAGYEVRHIKNITDVGHLTEDDVAQGDRGEDKIEKKARAEKRTPEEIARFYEEYFRETEKAVHILPAHSFPRATAHVPEMIRLIEVLVAKNHAYEKNGNVFLDVTSFKHYGRLSGNTLQKLKVGARLEEHPDKRHPWDFALWLKAGADHLMRWPSPWSEGYPGWHIECSAMSMEYLGEQFDIHTGGEDNIFPHHEAEIAQSESATDLAPFARFWVHSRHLLVDGEKMSKSKGNLYTLEDIEGRGFSPLDLRIALLSAHYRSQMNFTWSGMEQARANRKTLESFHDRLESLHASRRGNEEHGQEEHAPTPKSEEQESEEQSKNMAEYRAAFIDAIEDDLNTPLAFSILLSIVRSGNRDMDSGSPRESADVRRIFEECMGILGITLQKSIGIPAPVRRLAEARDTARRNKDYREADRVRAEIESAGYRVEDTPRGCTLKRIETPSTPDPPLRS